MEIIYRVPVLQIVLPGKDIFLLLKTRVVFKKVHISWEELT